VITGGRSTRLATPALVLAADHRARGIVTVEDYAAYLAAARASLVACDGVLASAQPLADLVASGDVGARHTYLSLNRTGLAGSSFELDDRLVASVGRARREGYSGIKVMVRIDHGDGRSAAALAMLGEVLEAASDEGLEALVESVCWRQGAMVLEPEEVVLGAVVAHDMGAPLLKVPVPRCDPGSSRASAVARVTRSVGVPVLFLGGPAPTDPAGFETHFLDLARDVMDGGGAGLALGRALLEHPEPGAMAEAVAAVVHGR
jgi:DhnA family fructose-bisphosphate aldolase class Ia